MASVDTTTNAGQLLAAASGGRRRLGDRVFSRAAILAAVTILLLLAGVAIFLLSEGFPALTAGASELRQLLGTSRRVIIPFLERLDRDGVTHRIGDKRVLGKAS